MTPVIPRYGENTLADLLPSIAAGLGVRGYRDSLDLPAAERWVVLLVDGLGWEQRDHWVEAAPHLDALIEGAAPFSCGVPSTTSTSITSLGTGLEPGRHGVAGYAFRYPGTGAVLNTLVWPPEVHALDVQPQPTVFERIASAGVRTAMVAPQRFQGSGLTLMGLRGPRFVGVRDESDRAGIVELVADASAGEGRSVVYAYERHLDHTGHGKGVGSTEWLAALAACDDLVADLRTVLPQDTRLVVVGDHGMVNVARGDWLVVEDEPDLLAGVACLAGEGRFRQLYAEPGQEGAVLDRWRDRLQGQAWVLSREEAFEAGWFGRRRQQVADRFGDVLVAMSGPGAVMTRSAPREFDLVGMHGSLTPAEMAIPLLVC